MALARSPPDESTPDDFSGKKVPGTFSEYMHVVCSSRTGQSSGVLCGMAHLGEEPQPAGVCGERSVLQVLPKRLGEVGGELCRRGRNSAA